MKINKCIEVMTGDHFVFINCNLTFDELVLLLDQIHDSGFKVIGDVDLHDFIEIDKRGLNDCYFLGSNKLAGFTERMSSLYTKTDYKKRPTVA